MLRGDAKVWTFKLSGKLVVNYIFIYNFNITDIRFPLTINIYFLIKRKKRLSWCSLSPIKICTDSFEIPCVCVRARVCVCVRARVCVCVTVCYGEFFKVKKLLPDCEESTYL